MKTVQTFFLSVNVKDSFCNKRCGFSLHDVSGKFVQTSDSGVGWGWEWGRGNLHVNGDGEYFMGMGGNVGNFIYRVTL